MADIDLVIKIPEDEYNIIKNSEKSNRPMVWVEHLIANGTPLEKIRERVELEKLGYPPSAGYYKAIMKVLQIIDKYKAESEE